MYGVKHSFLKVDAMRILLLEEKKNGLEFLIQQFRGVGGVSFMLAKNIDEIKEFVNKQHYDFCFISIDGNIDEKVEQIHSWISEHTMLVLCAEPGDQFKTEHLDDIITVYTKRERIMRLLGLSILSAKHRDNPTKHQFIQAIREIRSLSAQACYVANNE